MRVRLQPGEKLFVEMAWDEDYVLTEFEIHNSSSNQIVKQVFSAAENDQNNQVIYHAKYSKKTGFWNQKVLPVHAMNAKDAERVWKEIDEEENEAEQVPENPSESDTQLKDGKKVDKIPAF